MGFMLPLPKNLELMLPLLLLELLAYTETLASQNMSIRTIKATQPDFRPPSPGTAVFCTAISGQTWQTPYI